MSVTLFEGCEQLRAGVEGLRVQRSPPRARWGWAVQPMGLQERAVKEIVAWPATGFSEVLNDWKSGKRTDEPGR